MPCCTQQQLTATVNTAPHFYVVLGILSYWCDLVKVLPGHTSSPTANHVASK